MKPSDAPVPDELRYTFKDKFKAGLKGWPALALMTIIIGGIYGGIFTATEAAAVSLAFVIIFGVVSRRLKWADFLSSLKETAYQTAALFFIAIGAKIFVSFVSLTGVTGAFVAFVAGLASGWNPGWCCSLSSSCMSDWECSWTPSAPCC
ncbi:TRAP transporter large permease subunit [Marinobacter aromaticivorans]|uniref:TRAP transporter large permease subunit n=1 Tax=Marinobacter aromaticivorans TaxID=1494078 RepID=A0ABW2J0Z7_9GAMM|nr:TRAP transporter large permease subunit [Marinobacter aromaticivorans]